MKQKTFRGITGKATKCLDRSDVEMAVLFARVLADQFARIDAGAWEQPERQSARKDLGDAIVGVGGNDRCVVCYSP
jgi:hypothetical protein